MTEEQIAIGLIRTSIANKTRPYDTPTRFSMQVPGLAQPISFAVDRSGYGGALVATAISNTHTQVCPTSLAVEDAAYRYIKWCLRVLFDIRHTQGINNSQRLSPLHRLFHCEQR